MKIWVGIHTVVPSMKHLPYFSPNIVAPYKNEIVTKNILLTIISSDSRHYSVDKKKTVTCTCELLKFRDTGTPPLFGLIIKFN